MESRTLDFTKEVENLLKHFRKYSTLNCYVCFLFLYECVLLNMCTRLLMQQHPQDFKPIALVL
jgi:hypothetical protein